MRAACARGPDPRCSLRRRHESVAVTVDPKVITKILYSDSGHNTIFDLTYRRQGGGKAMIVDWQNEPIKGKLLHIDLKRIAMDKAIRVSVPVQLIGVPVGVKSGGGILEHVLHEVEIECLPAIFRPYRHRCLRAGCPRGSTRLRSAAPRTSKFLGDEGLTVAHVTVIEEEVVGGGGGRCADRTRGCQRGQGRDGSRARCQTGNQVRCQAGC